MSLSPVVKRVEVALAPAAAFDLFTRQMTRWWPLATHCCATGGALDVRFDERRGGEVVETGRDGSRHVWGTITRWDPPRAFAMTWHPKRAPQSATHVAVEFRDIGSGQCEVLLTHGGWVAVLDLFRQAAA